MVFGFESGSEVLLKIGLDIDGIRDGVREAKNQLTDLGDSLDTLKGGDSGIKWKDVFAVSSVVAGSSAAIMEYGNRTAKLNSIMDASATQIGITRNEVRQMMNAYSDAGMSATEFADSFDLLVRGGMADAKTIGQTVEKFDELAGATRTESSILIGQLIPAFNAFRIPLQDVGKYSDELTYLFRTTQVDMADLASTSQKVGSAFSRMGLTLQDEIALLKILNDTQGKTGRQATMLLNSAVSELEQTERNATEATEDLAESTEKLAILQQAAEEISKNYQDTIADLAEEQENLNRMARDYTYRIGDQESAIADLTLRYNEAMKAAGGSSEERAEIDQEYSERLGDQETKIKRLKEDYTAAMWAAAFDSNKKRELTEEYNRALADEEEALARLKQDHEQALAKAGPDLQKQADLTTEYNRQLAEQQEQLRRIKEQRDEALAAASNRIEEVRAKATEEYTRKIAENREEVDKLTKKQSEYRDAIEKGAASQEEFLKKLDITPEKLAAVKEEIDELSAGYAQTFDVINDQGDSAEERLFNQTEKTNLALGDQAENLRDVAAGVGAVSGAVAGLSGAVTLAQFLGIGATSGTAAATGLGGSTAVAAASAAGIGLAASFGGGILLGLAGVRGMVETGLLGDISRYGRLMEQKSPLISDAAKVLFAPIGMIGALAIDVATLQFARIPTSLNNVKGQAGEAAGRILDTIVSPFSSLYDRAHQWGYNLVVGIGNGIMSMYGYLRDTIKSISDLISSYLGIHSNARTGPLSDLMSWGPNLTQAIASGMVSEISAVTDASAAVAGAIGMAAGPFGSMAVTPAGGGGAPSSGGKSFVMYNDFSNLTIRDERDIELLTGQIETRINRRWASRL